MQIGLMLKENVNTLCFCVDLPSQLTPAQSRQGDKVMRVVCDISSRSSGPARLWHARLLLRLWPCGAGSGSPRLWSLTQPAVHHERADELEATRVHNLLRQNVNTPYLCVDWYTYLLNTLCS
jgi:hypothetical protein